MRATPAAPAAPTATVTVARTLATLGLLQLTLPVDSALTVAALVRSWVRSPTRSRTPARARGRARAMATGVPAPTAVAAAATTGTRTVLLSGGKMTKALALARAFHDAGHRVVLVESARYRLTAHRFSRAVDAFHVVPEATSPTYAAALRAIAAREGADVYVPVCSPVSSLADAEAKAGLEAAGVEVVHLDPGGLRTVDDKAAFAEAARALGLAVPDSHRITDPRQVLDFDFAARPRPYILKSIPYDPVSRLDLTRLPRPTRAETAAYLDTLPISPEHPWILQEFVEGLEYCTHGTVREGRLQVWVCCASSSWQLTYEMVDHPAIRAWVEAFVAGTGLTGQVSFDFIEDAAGTVHALECNPRTHSAITLLHGDPRVAGAYLARLPEGTPAVEPPIGGRPTHWTYHELWQALRHPRQAPGRLVTLLRGTDAVFSAEDPLPFWMLHHVHVPALLLANLRSLRPWLRVDLNIGKLVEPAGD